MATTTFSPHTEVRQEKQTSEPPAWTLWRDLRASLRGQELSDSQQGGAGSQNERVLEGNRSKSNPLCEKQDIGACLFISSPLYLPVLPVSASLLLCSSIDNKNSSHSTPSSLLCHATFAANRKTVHSLNFKKSRNHRRNQTI